MAKLIRVSKGAKAKADELGIDLKSIKGTGKNGSITINDISKVVENAIDIEPEFPTVEPVASVTPEKKPEVKTIADPPRNRSKQVRDPRDVLNFYEHEPTMITEDGTDLHLVRFRKKNGHDARICWWTKGQVHVWFHNHDIEVIADGSAPKTMFSLEFPRAVQLVLEKKAGGCRGCQS